MKYLSLVVLFIVPLSMAALAAENSAPVPADGYAKGHFQLIRWGVKQDSLHSEHYQSYKEVVCEGDIQVPVIDGRINHHGFVAPGSSICETSLRQKWNQNRKPVKVSMFYNVAFSPNQPLDEKMPSKIFQAFLSLNGHESTVGEVFADDQNTKQVTVGVEGKHGNYRKGAESLTLFVKFEE